MEYRIKKKPAFKVMGISKMFSYESANQDIPQFWDEVFAMAAQRPVLGMYGVCFGETMAGNQFRYMIADDYIAEKAEAMNLGVQDIPEHSWAVFPCKGPMPISRRECKIRSITRKFGFQ